MIVTPPGLRHDHDPAHPGPCSDWASGEGQLAGEGDRPDRRLPSHEGEQNIRCAAQVAPGEPVRLPARCRSADRGAVREGLFVVPSDGGRLSKLLGGLRPMDVSLIPGGLGCGVQLGVRRPSLPIPLGKINIAILIFRSTYAV